MCLILYKYTINISIKKILNKKRGSSEFPLLIVTLTDNGPKSPPSKRWDV